VSLPIWDEKGEAEALWLLRHHNPKLDTLELWERERKGIWKMRWSRLIARWTLSAKAPLHRRLLWSDREALYLGRQEDGTLEVITRREGMTRWRSHLNESRDWSLYIGLWRIKDLLLVVQRDRRTGEEILEARDAQKGSLRWQRRFRRGALRGFFVKEGRLFLHQVGFLYEISLVDGSGGGVSLVGWAYLWGDALWGFHWEEGRTALSWRRWDAKKARWFEAPEREHPLRLRDADPMRVLSAYRGDALWMAHRVGVLPCRRLAIYPLSGKERAQEIVFPAGYALATFYDTWGAMRLASSVWQMPRYRYLPLWLYRLDAPTTHKLILLDLVKRRIHWESQPLALPSMSLLHSGILQSEGLILIPLRWQGKEALWLLDAKAGVFRDIYQIHTAGTQGGLEMSALHPDQIRKGVLYGIHQEEAWSLDLQRGRLHAISKTPSDLSLRSLRPLFEGATGRWPKRKD
jgi:hypothetical protein